jgi:hypothetical protein
LVDLCLGGPGPVFGRDMIIARWLATVLTIPAALAMAATAHADGDSYIRYPNDHNIFVPGINDAVRISRGSARHELCPDTLGH